MKRWTLPLALATAMVYLTLSIGAAACLFSHQSTSRSAHHHTGGAVHSSLCAWACHANPTVDLPSTAPQSQPLRLILLLLLVGFALPTLLTQQQAQSRAPPRP